MIVKAFAGVTLSVLFRVGQTIDFSLHYWREHYPSMHLCTCPFQRPTISPHVVLEKLATQAEWVKRVVEPLQRYVCLRAPVLSISLFCRQDGHLAPSACHSSDKNGNTHDEYVCRDLSSWLLALVLSFTVMSALAFQCTFKRLSIEAFNRDFQCTFSMN